MIAPAWIIGFSGHRSLSDVETLSASVDRVLAALKDRIEKKGGVAHLFTSAAGGADLLALDAAARIGLTSHLVLPLPDDEFARDFDDPEEWSRAREAIRRCREGLQGETVRVLPANGVRPDCYFAQALDIAEVSDILLVVWDGCASSGPGGTADVVDLAIRYRKPVIRIDAATGDLVDSGGARTEGLPLPESWPAPDAIVWVLDELESESSIASALKEPADDAAVLQDELDAVSNQRAPEFRRGVTRAIWIHTIAALLGAIPSLFFFVFVKNQEARDSPEFKKWEDIAEWFTAGELALVLAALLVMLMLHLNRTRQKWITARFAAEVVRGIRAACPWIDPLKPLVARHRPEWHRFGLTAGLLAVERCGLSGSFEERRDAYRNARLRDQVAFFRNRAEIAEHRHHVLHLFAKWATILAPVAVCFALIDKVFDLHFTDAWWGAFLGKFLPVALPLTAASATAFRNSLDWTRRAVRYPEMTDRLAGLEEALAGMKTVETASAVVAKSEEILLDELIEWHLAARNSGAH